MKKAFGWFKKLPVLLQNATVVVGLISALGLIIPQIRQNFYLYVTILVSALWVLMLSWFVSLYFSKTQVRHKRKTRIIYPYRARSIMVFFVLAFVAFSVFIIPPSRQFVAMGVGLQPTPTSFSFRPANPGQSLMIISQFEDNSAGKVSGFDLSGRIYRLATDKIGENNSKFPVKKYMHVITSTEQARKVLDDYNATILIWGSYDAAGGRVEIEVDSETVLKSVCTRSDFEYSQNNPSSVELTFAHGIPAYAAHISFLSLGIIQADAKETEAAIDFLTQAIDVTVENQGTIVINPSDALNYRSYAYYKQDKFDLAIADLNAIESKDENTFYGLGEAYLANKQHDLAIENYSKSLELKQSFCAIGSRAIAYEKQHQYELAINDYEQAIVISPDNAKAYCFLGTAYGRNGDFPAAVAALEQGLKLDPTLGYCRDALNKAKKGIPVPQD